jgi:predicted transcriptional regulator
MDKATNKDVIMISIHPEYANSIFRGDKKIEFRKLNIPRHIAYVVLYVTAPERKIAGYFSVKGIVEGKTSDLWHRYHDVSGVTKQFFFKYYKTQDIGLGLLVDQVDIFQEPLGLDQLAMIKRPPQSFLYVDGSLWQVLKKRKKQISFIC